jgi:hypothetical protein
MRKFRRLLVKMKMEAFLLKVVRKIEEIHGRVNCYF